MPVHRDDSPWGHVLLTSEELGGNVPEASSALTADPETQKYAE